MGWVLSPLHQDQWQDEAHNLFNISLARMQITILYMTDGNFRDEGLTMAKDLISGL